MKYAQKYVGMDVSKDTIVIAIAESGREEARYWGSIPHKPEAVRKLIKQLGDKEQIEVCYEAGPTGYELYRWLTSMGVKCSVVAPSLIPKRAGDRIKTDRRDAMRLAQLFRAGELTSVYVPDRDTEALRDLVRAREDAKEDLHRARQRILKFMLRHQIYQPSTIKKRWTKSYKKWLGAIKFERSNEHFVFQDYLQVVLESEKRLERIEREIEQQSETAPQAEVIQAIQSLRGVGLVTAVTLVAEIGSFARFRSAQQLMAYAGIVPRERSSGETNWKGKITKSGNAHVRRVVTEAAWQYRHRPAMSARMQEKGHNQSAEIQAIAWKAQHRLHERYFRLIIQRGKQKCVAITAVGRELLGFIWAVAREVEQCKKAAA
ncbi:IS110 family transposase [Paenibacillus albiflavus]|uniref:IS110 family transposase n=1 Tax=Paenibacillus albiflavus TaxID=2545760 RepID=A0A4R4DY79_9BACL|nr:IS110 family transposase [Paenibacillus albiflavus]TCZ68558.1 IS110 family transposase [Paenibacillus albiflavus]TCZ69135.1 IS110 family transposase [Paenibacillus albiflavus]TCZ69299.1 IS110 family transposase [Paenibacillus albiflavus]TCZ71829.1 IS110 family transposase [Paenibacillus albiflavus]